MKNPACYVFPGANQCAPGDPFTEGQVADAQAFLDYKPFPFAKPLWARLADWLGLLAALVLGMAGVAALGGAIMQTPRARALLRTWPRPLLRWPHSAHAAIVAWALALRLGRRPRAVVIANPDGDEACVGGSARAPPPRPGGLIEIVLPTGVVVRVDAQVDAAALRCVLDVLAGAVTPAR